MFSSRLSSLVVCFLLSAGVSLTDAAEKLDLERTTPAPADQPVPLQDFLRGPLFFGPQLNDAGTHVAALSTNALDKTALLVVNLDTLETQSVLGAGDRDVRDFQWLNDTKLMYSLAKEKSGSEGAFVADLGRFNQTFPVIEIAGVAIAGVPEADRTHPWLHMLWDVEDGEGRKGQLVQVDASLSLISAGLNEDERQPGYLGARFRNRKHIVKTLPKPEGGLVERYVPDKDGGPAFGITVRDGFTTLHRWSGEQWIKTSLDLDTYRVVSYGEKPGELIVSGPEGSGQPPELVVMDASSGKTGEVVLADKGYGFYGALYRHPVTDQVLGVRYERNGPRMVWFTDGYIGIQKIVDEFFPGKIVRLVGGDRPEKRFFVSVYSEKQPETFYIIDLEKRSLGLIKGSRPWIDPERMRPVSMMKFKTTEGKSLDAYVTLPASASKERPAPLVVLPHDGPGGRDTWGFHGLAQMFASRGYAVLQPNYRGSTGYEWKFPYDDRWEYRKMSDDVTAATNTLLKTGLIDRARIAIVGSGFGAYLAVTGAVHEPDLYRCAAAIDGIYDWQRRMEDIKKGRFDSPEYGVLERRLGDPKDQPERFAALAPLRFVGRSTCPIFVVNGRDDDSVLESRRLLGELDRHKIPHESIFIAREGNGMAYVKNQVEVYSRILTFFDQHLRP